jgi:hypothetical protein
VRLLDTLAVCCRLGRMIENTTLSTGALARLFDTTPKTIATLGQKGISVSVIFPPNDSLFCLL